MMRWIFLWTVVVALSCATTKPVVYTTLTAEQLQPYGRTAVTGGQLELISSASHFGFSFEGTMAEVYASLSSWQHHNYLQYELDGIYQKRIRIDKGDNGPFKIAASNPGKHSVRIFKATEATTGPIYIDKVTGKNLIPLQSIQAPLIEFIGNSITCGAAADASEVPCGSGVYHDQHNAYYAYGPRVARELKVNFLLSSVSGIGVYRNWNSDGPSMSMVYEKTDFLSDGSRYWNFSQYDPAIVSIALGTNDLSNGDGKKPRLPFDSAAFVSNYVRFVGAVRSKYPGATIALLSSAMLNGDRRTKLENCIRTVKENSDRLYYGSGAIATYFFKPMQARGCTGHPSIEDHAILATELIPFFTRLLAER